MLSNVCMVLTSMLVSLQSERVRRSAEEEGVTGSSQRLVKGSMFRTETNAGGGERG